MSFMSTGFIVYSQESGELNYLSPGLLILLASPDGLELEPALYRIPTL